MKLSLKAGTTSKDVNILIQDSSVSTGAGKNGIAYNTSGLTAYYHRQGANAAVAITLATKTLGTWASGGFVEVDSSHMPGLYELGIPDAALAAGATWVVIMLLGVANMAPVTLEIELTATDNQNATIPTVTNVTTVNGLASGVITAASIANDAITDAKVASDVTIASVTGSVGSVTGNVGGNVVGSVGSLATQAKADVNAEADTALADAGVTPTVTGRIDAAVTSRLASGSYTAPDNATIAAISTAVNALNDITADDVVTALMAYAVESGKNYATVLKETYAILRGKYVANAAEPTSIVYYAPDGTTERVTFAVDSTTRTPS